MKETYIGDSVYMKFDGHYVRLYLNNGYGPKHEIAMEPEVIIKFLKQLDMIRAEHDKPREFSVSTAYQRGDLVTYHGKLYTCDPKIIIMEGRPESCIGHLPSEHNFFTHVPD